MSYQTFAMAPSWSTEPDTGDVHFERKGLGQHRQGYPGVGQLADLGPGEEHLALHAEAGTEMASEYAADLEPRVVLRL